MDACCVLRERSLPFFAQLNDLFLRNGLTQMCIAQKNVVDAATTLFARAFSPNAVECATALLPVTETRV
jgi:hypothetical protein